MDVRKCKGTHDLLPEDMVRFRRIEGAFNSCCSRWGYREVRTPLIEYLHLFTSVGTLTPDMLSRVYSFLDWDGWSGERVVLRPEGTIPVARLYVDNLGTGGPERLFYVGNTFIFDETGEKSRERWQCGAELIGGSNPEADAELVLLAADVLKRLKCGTVQMKLSHAGIVRGLIEAIGLGQGDEIEVLDRVLNGDIGVLREVADKEPQLHDLLSHLLDGRGKSASFLKNVKAAVLDVLPGIEASMNNFIRIAELLDVTGCDYEINLSSARGFEYYTGFIFQLYIGERKVGSGGRYDALIPLVGGGDIPACGFALYMGQLMEVMDNGGFDKAPESRVLLRCADDTVRGYKACFDVAMLLRQRGYVAEFDLGDMELSRYGWLILLSDSKTGATFVLIDCDSGKELGLGSLDEVFEMMEKAKCS
ncbi:MAG: ATP phosphoribosyltransferase regulatory subunit [Dehalococcoidia bacterium]|nr:ATP phosphoribosyltransferase regulatory subunit [Dehalococcoidia bacterium]